jgi:hypothetical protein
MAQMIESRNQRIVLSTFGSFGDVHPYVAIALELKARGHRPLIATSEVYREKMEALSIEFRPVRPVLPTIDQPDEMGRLVEGLMNASDGSEKVMQLLTPHLREIYNDLAAAGRPDRGADAQTALGLKCAGAHFLVLCL